MAYAFSIGIESYNLVSIRMQTGFSYYLLFYSIKMKNSHILIFIYIISFWVLEAEAQLSSSPWVVGKGHASFTLGYSRKTGGERWYPTNIDSKGTPSGADDTWDKDELSLAPNPIDGLIHDFRYAYFIPTIGLGDRLEISAVLLYLWGYERIDRDPASGKAIDPTWELNQGFTDSWLRLKYQLLKGQIPVSFEFNTRFPDLYDQPGDTYSRYVYQYVGGDTIVSESAEWRGVCKRDFGFLFHSGIGKSWGYLQATAGYNIRQGAYADQLLLAVSGGYNLKIGKKYTLTPNLLVDYTHGMGNGKIPDYSDRFYFGGRRNFYFNNGKYLRAYLSASGSLYKGVSWSAGVGSWLWGRGSMKYTEPYIQINYGI